MEGASVVLTPPPTPLRGSIIFRETNPRCLKGWGPLPCKHKVPPCCALATGWSLVLCVCLCVSRNMCGCPRASGYVYESVLLMGVCLSLHLCVSVFTALKVEVSVPQARPTLCDSAGEILPDRGSNSCLLLWQVDSLPLSRQGSACVPVYNASVCVCVCVCVRVCPCVSIFITTYVCV